MKFEDCSLFEQDMRHRIVSLEYDRLEFLSRPSIMQNIAVYPLGELFITIGDDGKTLTTGKTPDEALRKYDEWFRTGK